MRINAKRAWKLYRSGMSLTQVSEALGATFPGVRHALLRAGHKLRSRGEGVRLALRQGRRGTPPMGGSKNPSWKGGRHRRPDGYVMLYSPGHPRAHKKGYVFEHIFVWEKDHGSLPPGWHVHHLNGIRFDNRPENLTALPPRSHKEQHARTVDLLQARIRELEKELDRLRTSLPASPIR